MKGPCFPPISLVPKDGPRRYHQSADEVGDEDEGQVLGGIGSVHIGAPIQFNRSTSLADLLPEQSHRPILSPTKGGIGSWWHRSNSSQLPRVTELAFFSISLYVILPCCTAPVLGQNPQLYLTFDHLLTNASTSPGLTFWRGTTRWGISKGPVGSSS